MRARWACLALVLLAAAPAQALCIRSEGDNAEAKAVASTLCEQGGDIAVAYEVQLERPIAAVFLWVGPNVFSKAKANPLVLAGFATLPPFKGREVVVQARLVRVGGDEPYVQLRVGPDGKPVAWSEGVI